MLIHRCVISFACSRCRVPLLRLRLRLLHVQSKNIEQNETLKKNSKLCVVMRFLPPTTSNTPIDHLRLRQNATTNVLIRSLCLSGEMTNQNELKQNSIQNDPKIEFEIAIHHHQSEPRHYLTPRLPRTRTVNLFLQKLFKSYRHFFFSRKMIHLSLIRAFHTFTKFIYIFLRSIFFMCDPVDISCPQFCCLTLPAPAPPVSSS